jgi:hypothetical protein
MSGFDFIEAYKQLQPTADRAVIDLRKQGHDKILEGLTWPQVVDLARLSFNLPFDESAYQEWFQKPLHEADPHFFVAQDPAEAGRIATLALRRRVSGGQRTFAMIVLAASAAGKREAFDNGELVTDSKNLITSTAKKTGMKAPSDKIVLRKIGDLTKQKSELTTTFDQPHAIALVEAATQDLRGANEIAVAALNDSFQTLRGDNLRLAEEIDMLWWPVGDWSNILGIPRSAISKKSIGLVSGLDLGAMVTVVPGPYGAYGILKQALGTTADKPISIKDAIDGLDAEKIGHLALTQAPDVFPVLTALKLAAAGGDWAATFEKSVPDLVDTRLTHLELAIQAFRERVCMTGVGWA